MEERFNRVLTAISVLKDDCQSIEACLGVSDETVDYMLKIPGVRVATSLYAGGLYESPFAIDWVRLSVGNSKISAQRPHRPLTHEEELTLSQKGSHSAPSTTINHAGGPAC